MCEFILKNGNKCQARHKKGTLCNIHSKLECVICMENIQERNQCRKCKQCKNTFHWGCIYMTIILGKKSEQNFPCPICRTPENISTPKIENFIEETLKGETSDAFKDAVEKRRQPPEPEINQIIRYFSVLPEILPQILPENPENADNFYLEMENGSRIHVSLHRIPLN